MAYRVAGLPSVALSDVPTPERIQFGAPAGGIRGEGNWLARSLGLIPPVPVSGEAWGEMTPSEVEASGVEAGRSGNWKIIQMLATLASMFAPEAAVLAHVAGAETGRAEGVAKGTVRGAEQRHFAKRMEELLQQTEGLLPTPSSAEAGYMPVGVARGMQAESLRDKAALARERVVGKIEGAITPLVERMMKGAALSAQEQDNLTWGLQVLQSLRPPAAGFLGQPMAPQPIPPLPRRGGKSEPTPKEGGAAPRKLIPERTAINKAGLRVWRYDDGTWRDASGKEY